jgi:hypothetical protein
MPDWVGVGVVTPLPGVVVVGEEEEREEEEEEVVVGEVVIGDLVVVIEDLVVVIEDLVVVDVVVGPSSVKVPITQYSLLASRLGQVIPGFSLVSSSSDNPKPSARLWQVSPLLTGVE